MLAALIVLDVAFHAGRTNTVSAADIAERAGLARRGIEPLLQALSRSGMLESVRGPKGGYRLGRPRRDIRLDEVLRAAHCDEPAAEDGPQGALQGQVIDPLWAELEGVLADRLAGISLDDLVRRALAAGLKRPQTEPITFSI
jgi:Rrf2 family protein